MRLVLFFATVASSGGVIKISDNSSGINPAVTRGFSGEKRVDDVDRDGEEFKGVDKYPVTWTDREDKRATDSLVEEDVSITALEVTTTVFSLDSEDETGIKLDSELEGISDWDLRDCETEKFGWQLEFSELELLVELKT